MTHSSPFFEPDFLVPSFTEVLSQLALPPHKLSPPAVGLLDAAFFDVLFVSDASFIDRLSDGTFARLAAVSRGLPAPVSLPLRPSLAVHSMMRPGVVI
jgi:hypothetical protein